MELLEMSISAGVLILFIAVLRKGGLWRLAKRTVMMLWLVVLARLLLPCSLPVQNGIAAPVFCLLRRIGGLHRDLAKDAGTKAGASMVPKAASFGTSSLGFMDSSFLQRLAGLIWLAGVVGTGIYFVSVFFKEYRLLSEALPLDSREEASPCKQILEPYEAAARLAGRNRQKKSIQILVHDQIRSPLVFGIARQRIVIPKGLLYLDKVQMQHVLVHEMVHIRRYDNLWKLLAAAAACIHWFNPAVWLMYLLFARDQELSCDEQVLSMYGSQGRQEYAMALLALARNQKETGMFCSGFLENPVKERIVAIMKYKKLTGIGVLCTVLLLAGATSVFATNEQKAEIQEQDAEGQDHAREQDTDMQDEVYYTLVSTENGETRIDKSGKATIKNIDDIRDGEHEAIWLSFNEEIGLKDGEEVLLSCNPASDAGENIYYEYEDKDGTKQAYRIEKGAAGQESNYVKKTYNAQGLKTEAEKLQEANVSYDDSDNEEAYPELKAEGEANVQNLEVQ